MSTQRIGKYTIVRKLGSGAMGTVYEGFDPDIERRVAIKTLHRNLIDGMSGQEFLARFKREAQAAARCMHPNIVTVLEYGQTNETPFIVMEFVEGQSLDQFLNGYPRLTLKQVIGLFLHVLRGLHAAHRQGIIHRDVKPSNVMITVEGVVKLGDFGIARITADAHQTQTHQLLGTPRYMSPEQAYGSELDQRSDLYSATLVLMELLRHLQDENLRRVPLPEHLTLPASGHIHTGQLFPEIFLPVLTRGLASNPASRFADAQQFANALKDIVDGRPAMGTAAFASASAETQEYHPTQNRDVIPRTLPANLEHLAVEYLGPLAYNLIRYAQSSSGSGEGVLSALAARIADDQERQRFIVRWRQLQRNDRGSYSSLPGADAVSLASADRARLRGAAAGMQLTEDTISLLAYHYAHFIGPLAPRLVRYQLTQSRNVQELLQNLADKIPNTRERQTFLQKARGLLG